MNTFTTPVRSQLTQQLLSDLAMRIWNLTVPAERPSLITEMDPWIAEQAKTFVFVLVGLFALFVWPVLAQRKRFYAQHLVYSVHFFSLVLLLLPVVAIVHQWLPAVSSDLILGIVFVVYFWRSNVVAYDLSKLTAALVTAYQVVALLVSIAIYRLALFILALICHGAFSVN